MKNLLLVVATMIGLSPIAIANEECPNPATVDSAYVPCVSAVDYGNGHVDPGWRGNSGYTAEHCFQNNRDGRACNYVGFGEGQIGSPWGQHVGNFQCVNGCLKWLG